MLPYIDIDVVTVAQLQVSQIFFLLHQDIFRIILSDSIAKFVPLSDVIYINSLLVPKDFLNLVVSEYTSA